MLLPKAWVCGHTLGLIFSSIAFVTGLVSIGQAHDERVGYYCQLAEPGESWSRCDGVLAANLLQLCISALTLNWLFNGDPRRWNDRETILGVKLFQDLASSVLLMVMIVYLGGAGRSSSTIIATISMAMLALITTGFSLVYGAYTLCCGGPDGGVAYVPAGGQGWTPMDLIIRACSVMLFAFPFSNILVLNTGHHTWKATSTTCVFGPDFPATATCTVGWVASCIFLIGLVLLRVLLERFSRRNQCLALDMYALECLITAFLGLALQLAAAIICSMNFNSAWTSPVNYRDGKTRYGALSVIVFLWVQVAAWWFVGMPMVVDGSFRHLLP